MTQQFEDGKLSGRVELRGLLTATEALSGFQTDSWHDDYEDMKFDIQAGAVLAEDDPKEYWIDTAEEAPVGSIFELQKDRALTVGEYRCQLSDEKVLLRMSPGDYDCFLIARRRAYGKPDAAYILNAVYFPALVYALQQADRDDESFGDLRWYRSLNKRLEDCGCPPLGESGDRLSDAQKLLEKPFSNLPLMKVDPAGDT